MGRAALCSVLVAILLAPALVHGAKKRWKGPTNIFHSPANWQSGNVPCSADNVTFQPTWTPTTIYVQNDLTVKSLKLPMNGVLILGKPLTIKFDPDDITCSTGTARSGQNSVFKGQEPGNWDNPNNWETLDSNNNPVSTTSLAATDRLPCETDSVVFPSKSAMAVQLNHPVTVSSLQIGDTVMTPASLMQYLQTDAGKGQFRLPSSDAITISGAQCAQSTCACGNSGVDVKRSACSFLGTCPAAVGNCRQPVTLTGDCCAYCGGLLNLTVSSGFAMSTFEAQVKKVIGSQPYKIRTVNNKQIQVLLHGQNGDTVVGKLRDSILADPTVYTISLNPVINVQKSLDPLTPSPRTIIETKPVSVEVTQKCEPPSTNGEGVGINPGETGESKGSSSSNNTPWFVVAAVGVILLIVIIIIIVYFVTRNRVEKKKEREIAKVHFVHHAEMMPTGSTTDLMDGGIASINTGYGGGMTNPLYDTVKGGDDLPTELPQ